MGDIINASFPLLLRYKLMMEWRRSAEINTQSFRWEQDGQSTRTSQWLVWQVKAVCCHTCRRKKKRLCSPSSIWSAADGSFIEREWSWSSALQLNHPTGNLPSQWVFIFVWRSCPVSPKVMQPAETRVWMKRRPEWSRQQIPLMTSFILQVKIVWNNQSALFLITR